MPDLSIFHARVAAFSAADTQVDGMLRIISSAPCETLCDALVTEVMHTQLPRQLSFQNGKGEVLTLFVKAGRVTGGRFRVSESGRENSIKAHSKDTAIADQQLSTELPDLVVSLTDGYNTLQVVSDFFDASMQSNQTGVDLGSILLAHRESKNEQHVPNAALTKFLSEISLAKIRRSGSGQHIAEGPPTLVAKIEAAIKHLPKPVALSRQCLVMSDDQFDAPALVSISRMNLVTFALIDKMHIPEILSLWAQDDTS